MDIQMPDKVGQPKKGRAKEIFKIAVPVVLAAIAIFCVLAYTPIFTADLMVINGLEHLDYQAVSDAAGIVQGDNLLFLSKRKIEKSIEALAYVEDAKLIKRYPKTVEIQITESKPAMLVPFVTGYIVLDRNSKVLEAVSDRTGYNAVVIKGVSVRGCVPGEIIEYSGEQEQALVNEMIQAFEEAEILGRITEVDLSDVYEVYVTVQNTLTAKVGNTDNLAYKCRILSSILDNIASPPKGYVDLTSNESFFYKENYSGSQSGVWFDLPSSDASLYNTPEPTPTPEPEVTEDVEPVENTDAE